MTYCADMARIAEPGSLFVQGGDSTLGMREDRAGAAAYLRKSAGLGAVVDVIFAVSVTATVC